MYLTATVVKSGALIIYGRRVHGRHSGREAYELGSLAKKARSCEKASQSAAVNVEDLLGCLRPLRH